MSYKNIALLFLFLVQPLSIFANDKFHFPKNIDSFFKNYQACVLLRDLKSEKTLVFNEQQCKTRYYPNSTFKIANSLIGLESGVIPNKDFVIKWDGKPKYFKSWEKDHSLASAIKVSAVPYYKELARRVGPEKSREYLKLWSYGNQKVGDKIDSYWLGGPLRISAYEQIEFLEKLYKKQLLAQSKNIDTLKEIIKLDAKPNYVLSGKTGSFMKNSKVVRGWFVGHLKTKNNEYVFATNIIGAENAWGRDAQTMFSNLLKDMGLLK